MGLTNPVLWVAALTLWVGAPTGADLQAAHADTLAVLTGEVRAREYRSDGLLPGAVLEVRQGGAVRRTVADRDGRYTVRGLASGPAELSVLHLAAYPLRMGVRLPASGQLEVNVELDRRIIELVGVEVEARGVAGLNRPMAPLREVDRRSPGIGLRALEASSGMAEAGLASALPGEEARDPERVLFMRGSAVDARMVLIDGAPIHTPFHAAGLVEPFYSEFLGYSELYLGGAPSPYGDGLSYLVDLETRPARRDRIRASAAADGLTLSGAAEVPLGSRAGVLAGGRYLHGLQGTLFDSSSFPYRYGDVLVRAGGELGERHALRLTAFGNREGVRLDMLPDEPGSGDDAHWGNRVLSLRHEGEVGPLGVQTTISTSAYDSGLPVHWEDPVLARGGSDRARIATELTFAAGEGRLRVGGALERQRIEYRLDALDRSVGVESVTPEPAAMETTGTGLFVEWEGAINPTVHLRTGLRGDHYGHEGRLRVAPRISARFVLNDRAALLASGGVYHQPLPTPGLRPGGDEGMELEGPLAWSPSLPVASASHLLLGLEQELEGAFELGVSGFVKRFSGVGSEQIERSRSSGAELRLAREGERLHGWLGYHISWYWMDEGVQGSTRFDGRHLVSLGLEGSAFDGLELNATLGYGSGLPLTSVELTSATADGPSEDQRSGSQTLSTEQRMNTGGVTTPLELAPEDDFLRLDLEVGWPMEPTLGGRSTRLRPYVKLLNALDRRDALFYYFDQWRGDRPDPLARTPFMPLIGVEWRF